MSTLPLLTGIRPGSSLALLLPIPVTCETDNTSSLSYIQWLVNGRQIYEDTKLFSDFDTVTSNWIYVPEINDVVVECKVKGNESRSAFVFFTVANEKNQINGETSSYSSNHGNHQYINLQLLCTALLYLVHERW